MEEKSSKCLTVIPPNIEKWEEKEERSLRGNSGISTVSIPFEKGRRDRTRGREKQNYQAFKLGEERERVSLLGDHLADISPGQGLVFRTRHYHSVFLSFSYNPRPVFVPHVSSRSDVAIVPSWRANGIMNRASCYEVTLA